MTAPTLSDLQAKISRKAWEDPAFEAEFMSDPKATFEKYLGQPLPESLAIHAHYNSASELHFVLPRREAAADGELTDDDLERVAGGEILVLGTIGATISLAAITVSLIAQGVQDHW